MSMYIHIYISLSLYIYIYIYMYVASQDVRPSGPNPWKVSLALPVLERCPGPPNPWSKSCAGKSCDANWTGKCIGKESIWNKVQESLVIRIGKESELGREVLGTKCRKVL